MNLDLCILKVIITNEKYGFEFAFALNHNLFLNDYQVFARHVIEYMKAYRVLPTRRVILERTPVVQVIVNRIWDELDNFEYDINEYLFDLEKLKNRFAGRSLENIKQKLLNFNNLHDNPELIINDINSKLNEIKAIKEERAFIQETVQDYVKNFLPQYEAKSELSDEDKLVSIKTGYSAIDNVTDGIHDSELIIFGGETNAGKSQFLLNTAIQMWLQDNTIYTLPSGFTTGFNIIFFSLEMPYEQVFARFMARLADVNERSLNKGTLESDELDRLHRAVEFINNYPNKFMIVDMPRNVTMDNIELRYKDALLQFQPHVVGIDYLGLLGSTQNSKDGDWLRLSQIAEQVYKFGRAYKLITLTAVQLTDVKRGAIGKKLEQDSTVGLHRVGRSSLISHHANLFVQIEKRPSEETYGDFKYHIIKNRRGPLASGTLIKKFANASLLDNPYDNIPKSNENPTPAPIIGNQSDISNKVKNIQDYLNRKKDEPGP